MSSGLHSHDRFWKDGNGQSYSYPSDFPTVGVPIDISATDADFSAAPLRWVYCGTAGVLSVQLVGDTQLRSFPVAANSVFKGIVAKVGKAATTTTVTMGAR